MQSINSHCYCFGGSGSAVTSPQNVQAKGLDTSLNESITTACLLNMVDIPPSVDHIYMTIRKIDIVDVSDLWK